MGYSAVYPYVVRVYNSDSQKVTAAIKMIKHFKVREGGHVFIYPLYECPVPFSQYRRTLCVCDSYYSV